RGGVGEAGRGGGGGGLGCGGSGGPPSGTLFPYTTLFRSHARERLGQRHRDARVALVVGEPDVEAWLMLLDEVVLEQQRLGLGRRSEEHTSELQSRSDLVCRLLLEKTTAPPPPRPRPHPPR